MMPEEIKFQKDLETAKLPEYMLLHIIAKKADDDAGAKDVAHEEGDA